MHSTRDGKQGRVGGDHADSGAPAAPVHAADSAPGLQDFAEADRVEPLLPDEVHLWLWRSQQAFPPREVSALARAELGRLLQEYAGVAAAPPIERGEHGKPFVSASGFPRFNLSHSGQCVVFAFCAHHEIGVDVEALGRRHSPLELANRFFAAEETAALAALDEAAQGVAFMRLWTSKEAVLKALGHGISFGLHRLRFALDEGGGVGLQAIAAEAGTPEEWRLRCFEPAPGHAGALAWRGPDLRVRAFRLRRPE